MLMCRESILELKQAKRRTSMMYQQNQNCSTTTEVFGAYYIYWVANEIELTSEFTILKRKALTIASKQMQLLNGSLSFTSEKRDQTLSCTLEFNPYAV